MKKGFVILSGMVLASSLALAACGSDEAAQNAAAPSGAESVSSGDAGSGAEAQPAAQTTADAIQASDMSKLPSVAQQRTDTIIVGLTDPSGAFTPYFHQSGYDGNVSSLLYQSLLTVDDQGLPVGNLAESYEVSDDEKTYTFHLPKDAVFSDGSPLTAEDVAFTWTILHDKAYDGDSQIPELGIVGGADYKAGKADSVSGIKVIDPQTVSVTLENVDASAILQLGGDVLSKAYYGKDYKFGELEYIKKLHENPLGNGPYKLEKFIPGQEVRMIANDKYAKGKPATEHFIYKTSEGDAWQFVETGEIDYSSFAATQENLDKIKGLGFLSTVPYTPSTYGYLTLNHEHKQLQDKAVRQALTYGLDRQSIYVDANQGAGEVANIPTSPISWSYTTENINPYAYDPDKANQLLDEAGWVAGSDGIREKDGQKLTIHYLGRKSPDTDVFIALAEENYKAIGVDFQPEVLADFNALVSKVEGGDYDMAAFSTAMMTDPSEGITQFIDGEVLGYDNPEVTKLNKEALAVTDTAKRKEIYQKLYEVVNDDLPVIFTNYRKIVYAYNGRIENVTVSPFTGLADGLSEWTLK
ncbi:ABC transporter substrate-binding protein [Saccharibacillus sp. CPCC 101409]|uniref:ABC transporter substrate-binding protein n=1 Tax=Saccharibacillus sp. CPCC 101409 TaxID=3058041 RepID=UPI0026718614|nr:ABC transporter substrate-binding protein [Saccharibacillus sp. CPCC 101409]MDO3413070.1 ABC transporter substrate-binding protein [Saccharibacillus sp. CPCC 101409]